MIMAPHPDDAELAIGGTIVSLTKNNNIFLLDMTNGEPTPHGSIETRLNEAKKAANILNIKKRITLDLPNRYLQDTIEYRQAIAEKIREYKPEILLIPYKIDAHPDHIASHYLGLASRFYSKFTKSKMKGEPFYPSKLFFYFPSHMRINIHPTFIYPVTEKEFQKKRQAIRAYRSQFFYGKNKQIPEFIDIIGKYWGKLISSDYGEPFYTPEVIGIKDMGCIV